MPAAPEYVPSWQPPAEIPQREDYEPPVVADSNTGVVTIEVKDALAIHRFLEVNAVYPETKAMADKLREIIEGRA